MHTLTHHGRNAFPPVPFLYMYVDSDRRSDSPVFDGEGSAAIEAVARFVATHERSLSLKAAVALADNAATRAEVGQEASAVSDGNG
jgi:hypothetical protein